MTAEQLLLVGAGQPAPSNRPPSQHSRTWRCGVTCPECGKEADHLLTGANGRGIPGWTCDKCHNTWYGNPWVSRPPLPEWRTQ